MEDLINNFKLVMEKSFDFEGRASRREFWMFSLATFLAGIILGIIGKMIMFLWILKGIFNLIVLPASIAVGARRLHDIGKSGWWQLLWLIPIVGWIILFIWDVTEGNKQSNSYGADPYAKSDEAPVPAPEARNPFEDAAILKESPFEKQS